ncbi:hypothetical protein B5F29_01150 [Lachnoclostridium sp. An196]|nr:hypothetical protein B5F29_01150 [Lachnoclostridium sp. An196]
MVTAKQSRCKARALNRDEKTSGIIKEPEQCFQLIIPGLFEPPVRTLRATVPENEIRIFR